MNRMHLFGLVFAFVFSAALYSEEAATPPANEEIPTIREFTVTSETPLIVDDPTTAAFFELAATDLPARKAALPKVAAAGEEKVVSEEPVPQAPATKEEAPKAESAPAPEVKEEAPALSSPILRALAEGREVLTSSRILREIVAASAKQAAIERGTAARLRSQGLATETQEKAEGRRMEEEALYASFVADVEAARAATAECRRRNGLPSLDEEVKPAVSEVVPATTEETPAPKKRGRFSRRKAE